MSTRSVALTGRLGYGLLRTGTRPPPSCCESLFSNLNTMLLPEEILAESFVDEKELVAKILLGVREREGGGASDARLKTRKRHESYNRDGSAM